MNRQIFKALITGCICSFTLLGVSAWSDPYSDTAVFANDHPFEVCLSDYGSLDDPDDVIASAGEPTAISGASTQFGLEYTTHSPLLPRYRPQVRGPPDFPCS